MGSLVIRELYRQYHDRWLLDLTFDGLLRWNRWWPTHRDTGGLLCWRSDNLPPDGAAHSWQGAAYESGLDNSPMYDGVPFNSKTNQLQLADVGLTSLYIADCKALAELAQILNRTTEAAELHQRANSYCKSLQTLWQEETGIFLNHRRIHGRVCRPDVGLFRARTQPLDTRSVYCRPG